MNEILTHKMSAASINTVTLLTRSRETSLCLGMCLAGMCSDSATCSRKCLWSVYECAYSKRL